MPLFTPPRAQYADSNGNPLAGAKLYFYRTGTSTPQDTYTDSGLTTANANPVVADASGIFGSIYLSTSNDYKVILKNSADTTIWTVDPYLASAGAGRTAVADANYSATINDRFIAYTSITASRTVTLPPALTFPAGTRLVIVDESGSASSPTKVIQATPAGSDTINGAAGTQYAITTAYGSAEFESNGDAGWFWIARSLPTVPRGHIAGLTLSTAGSSATFSVAAGQAADKNGAVLMALTSAMSKTTSAWAAGTGAGALDTGTIANSTGYHVHLIMTTAGVVDVLVSTSATAPTMPSGYTYARRIGWMKTNGSAQWTSFIQNGDQFKWLAGVADYTAVPGVTTRQNLALSVPSGVVVFPILSVSLTSGGGSGATQLLTSLDETDTAPSATVNHGSVPGASQQSAVFEVNSLHTNTSAQIGRRINTTDGQINVYTLGWVDPRGRND